MPAYVSGMLVGNGAWNGHNPAVFFHPADKFIAVISLISQNQPAFRSDRSNRACAIQISLQFPLEGQKRNEFQSLFVTAWLSLLSLLYSVRFLCVSPLFLVPLACWRTLTVVLSGISAAPSTGTCSIRAERIRSHTPVLAHTRSRLYTLCHGLNHSGKSRHRVPLFSQYRIVLSISRLLFPGRLPWSFISYGNRCSILFHCF